MSNPITDSKTFSALNMASDLRQNLQTLKAQIDEVAVDEQEAEGCMVQKMIALISATTLVHSLAQELGHRLHLNEEPKKVCPADCELYCPWFRAAQRVDRWKKELEDDPELYRLALYDFQRGISMAASLGDYLEKGLQQADNDPQLQSFGQSASCLSSWMRKLVQLLYLISSHAGCQKHAHEKLCV